MKRQLTEESHLVYGSRGIRVHHGGKVWQQAEDMTGGAETKELTSLTISTKQIVNWKKHVTVKLHTSYTNILLNLHKQHQQLGTKNPNIRVHQGHPYSHHHITFPVGPCLFHNTK